MKKYPHGLTLNAVCAAIDDYQRHEDSTPEEGILAAFNTLLGHSDIAEALRSMERTADVNMAAAQAMRDDMYHWKQRAEAAEELVKIAERTMDYQAGVITELGIRAEAAESDNRNYSEVLSYHIDRQVKAEAKLAELEKQDPYGYADPKAIERMINGYTRFYTVKPDRSVRNSLPVFVNPVPSINLAELVPSKLEEKEGDYQSLRDEKRGYNACIAAILRNIEEAK